METNKARRGRKPSGTKKVVYYRRVEPEMAVLLDQRLSETSKEKFDEMKAYVEVNDVRRLPDPQIKALLDNVEQLENEKIDLQRRLDKCAAASDDQKTHWWKMKYEALAAKVGLNDSDQTLG